MPLCGGCPCAAGILRNALEGNGEGKGKGEGEGLGLWDKIFVALRARGLFRCSLFGPPARRAAGGGGEGLSFGMRFLSACGRGAFLLLFIWAACAAGGRWGPVRGCRPSEAPSALPPDDPAGLVVYSHSHGLAPEGFPYSTIPRGLRGFCFGSFLAALGDLPARRAMPACAFALNERTGDVWLA